MGINDEDGVTLGAFVDNVLSQIELIANALDDRLGDLERRVFELENTDNEPTTVVTNTEPVAVEILEDDDNEVTVIDETPSALITEGFSSTGLVVLPRTTFETDNPVELRSGCKLVIPSMAYYQSLSLVGLEDVDLVITGRVGTIMIANCSRVRISGDGALNSLRVTDYVNGVAGHWSRDLMIQGLRFLTTDTAMDIQHVIGVEIDSVVADDLDRYGLWMSNCQNISIMHCGFRTSGQESCVRLVDVDNATVGLNRFVSDAKHCFRVHGRSNAVTLNACTLRGPRGMMLGTMPGDLLSNILISDNWIEKAVVQVLGVPVESPQALVNFTWSNNAISESVTGEVSSYVGLRDDWLFE